MTWASTNFAVNYLIYVVVMAVAGFFMVNAYIKKINNDLNFIKKYKMDFDSYVSYRGLGRICYPSYEENPDAEYEAPDAMVAVECYDDLVRKSSRVKEVLNSSRIMGAQKFPGKIAYIEDLVGAKSYIDAPTKPHSEDRRISDNIKNAVPGCYMSVNNILLECEGYLSNKFIELKKKRWNPLYTFTESARFAARSALYLIINSDSINENGASTRESSFLFFAYALLIGLPFAGILKEIPLIFSEFSKWIIPLALTFF